MCLNFALFLKHKKNCFIILIKKKMKKLFLSFAVIAGMSMISCGNKAEQAENAADSTAVEVVEEVVDTTVVAPADTVVADTVVAAVAE